MYKIKFPALNFCSNKKAGQTEIQSARPMFCFLYLYLFLIGFIFYKTTSQLCETMSKRNNKAKRIWNFVNQVKSESIL